MPATVITLAIAGMPVTAGTPATAVTHTAIARTPVKRRNSQSASNVMEGTLH
jgi:hypothetical protein